MDNGFYVLDIQGRKENLPILPLPSGEKIAFINLHGNQELTEYCGKLIAEKIKGTCDALITIESKGLQLTHVVARELGFKYYAVARKSKKLYMQDGISISYDSSITTGKTQNLYLSQHDIDQIKGKKVCIVDDVVSTGASLKGLEKLIELAGGSVVQRAFVVAEGVARERKDIVYLSTLPLL